MSVQELPPRGFYLAREAGQLAGVSGDHIGQWARRGYIRSSQSGAGEVPRVYSFQDVAEAMIVHELLNAHVPHREIRAAVQTLRDENGSAWPLTRGEVAAADGAVVVRRDDRHFDVGTHPWQRFIDESNLQEVASELSRGGWAVRDLPDLRHIEVNPGILSGRPVVRGHRVSAEKVARLAATEQGIKTLTADYALSGPEIRDAKRWWDAAHGFELAA